MPGERPATTPAPRVASTATTSRARRDPEVVGGAFRFRFDRGGARLRLVEWGARLRSALFAMPYGDQALFVRRALLDELGLRLRFTIDGKPVVVPAGIVSGLVVVTT